MQINKLKYTDLNVVKQYFFFKFILVYLGYSRIQNLSLRNCYINDMGAKMIGRALTPNKSLTTLNLCYNKITCEGAACIAKVRKGQWGKRLNTDSISYYTWLKSN